MFLQKLFFSVLLISLSSPTIAIPVYWDMSFLNDSGDHVGNASFYYDDETTDRLVTGGISDVTTKVEWFEGYLDGVGELKLMKTNYWFDEAADLTVGSTVDSRYGNNGQLWSFNEFTVFDEVIYQYDYYYGAVLSVYDDDKLVADYDGDSVTGGIWRSRTQGERTKI